MAKFNIGDKVKDPEGVIRTVARVSVKDGKELVEYAYHDDMKRIAGGNWADDVTLANATCKNAMFKVGDKVEIIAGPKQGKRGKVETVAFGPMGGVMYHILLDEGYLTDAAERNLKIANSTTCNSTNPVVLKAMNACGTARNENLPYMIVVDTPTKKEILSPLFASEWAATARAKDVALKTSDKVSVIHKPDGKVVWENACGTATNASDDFVTADFIFKVERAENPLNDFIHYEIKDVDKGSLPRTRKDMLIDKVKRLLADAKRKVASLESGLRALEQVK